jgi:hypothetical protein
MSSVRGFSSRTRAIVVCSVVTCLFAAARGQNQPPSAASASTTQPLNEKAAAQLISGTTVRQPRPALELSPEFASEFFNGMNDDAMTGMAGAAAYSRFQALDRINAVHAKWRKDAATKGLVFLTSIQPTNVVATFDIENGSADADAKAIRLAAAQKILDEQKNGEKYDFSDEIRASYFYGNINLGGRAGYSHPKAAGPLVESYFWGPASKRPVIASKIVPIASLVCWGPLLIDYSLDGSFAAFRTGVAAAINNTGISFRVLLDRKEAWRCDGPVDMSEQKSCLLDIRGVKLLTLMIYQVGSSPNNGLAQSSAWTNPVLLRHLPANSGSSAKQNTKSAAPSDNQPIKNPAEVQAIEKQIEDVRAKLNSSTLGSEERAHLAAELMQLRKSLRSAKGE